MAKFAVVYWSGTGNTETMAQFVVEGIRAGGGEADLFTASEFSAELAGGYAGLALGCPSMGSEVLEETEFEPMYQAIKPVLGGKSVALFGSYGWGDGEWMRNWAEDCESTGCSLVAEPVIANETPQDDDASACRALGEALAKA